MLIGMGLFKLGVLSARRSARFYATSVAVAALMAVPLIAYGMQGNIVAGWPVPESFFFGQQLNYWMRPVVSLGWIGLVMLACQRGWAPALTARLAAVGQMAFTNYIMQTVLCTWIFYGHGLGLFGRLERASQLGIVLAVWALQVAISPIWLRHFRFGQLEWLWRTLVYRRAQPMPRRVAVAA
jgi:uncharacterized protein